MTAETTPTAHLPTLAAQLVTEWQAQQARETAYAKGRPGWPEAARATDRAATYKRCAEELAHALDLSQAPDTSDPKAG